MRHGERPVIVGLTHFPNRSITDADLERVGREAERAAKVMTGLPRGTRVGLELSRKDLQLVPRLDRFHLFLVIANAAQRRGLELVPLDLESGNRRHRVLEIEGRRAMRIIKSTDDPEARERYVKSVRDFWLTAKMRSVAMGKRILRHQPAVSFIGNGHAVDLQEPLGETHRFDLSPEPEGRVSAWLEDRYLLPGMRDYITRRLEAELRRPRPPV